ncbi:MAG: NapC/NirT family cytochrome c [Deltaproteobacteria bacterium]|nr:NapC/NirT family cytochrome c [Deltaproteobacteria bacterium]
MLNIVLLTVLLVQREWILQRMGKVLFFLVVIVFPTLVVAATFALNIKNSESVSFCLGCHEMGPYVDSLHEDDDEMIPTIHYQNNWVEQKEACYQCHTDYTVFGPIKAKVRGLMHIYVHYIKGAPKDIALYKPYNNRECLRCHEGAKRFENLPQHQQDPKMLLRLKINKQSCMDKGCHDVTHEVYPDEEYSDEGTDEVYSNDE